MVNAKRPLVATNMTPSEILTDDEMRMLVDYCDIYYKHCGDGDYPDKEINKVFSSDGRKKVAVAFERLRDCGMYPSGIIGDGAYKKVKFVYALKSESQELFESGLSELEGLSRDQLRQKAVGGFIEMRDQDHFKVDSVEKSFEKIL